MRLADLDYRWTLIVHSQIVTRLTKQAYLKGWLVSILKPCNSLTTFPMHKNLQLPGFRNPEGSQSRLCRITKYDIFLNTKKWWLPLTCAKILARSELVAASEERSDNVICAEEFHTKVVYYIPYEQEYDTPAKVYMKWWKSVPQPKCMKFLKSDQYFLITYPLAWGAPNWARITCDMPTMWLTDSQS